MVEFFMCALLSAMVILLVVIVALVSDNNRIAREVHAKNIEVAWHKSIVEAFIGKVERERGK
jgi:hypothetical protein